MMESIKQSKDCFQLCLIFLGRLQPRRFRVFYELRPVYSNIILKQYTYLALGHRYNNLNKGMKIFRSESLKNDGFDDV